MAKLPLITGVLNYIKENNIRFCMPGHKGGSGFKTTKIGRELYQNFVNGDITEVEGLDNFHNPKGIIKESQQCLSDFYGSKKSYFLVNGSTSGNLTMIFSSFNEGDKIIVERNCHKSIFNGIILRKLKPIYIKNKINHKYNAPLSIDEEHFLHILEEHSDAKGIIVTYPNYYGICPNLEFIVKEAKKRNIKVLIDSAHGAHFGIINELPKSALELGANMVVMSAHKTLPSLTQTAYLHIGDSVNVDSVELYLNMFLSTSPSYMLMCSMDYARFYLEERGKEDYKKLIEITKKYKDKINRIDAMHIIGKEDLEDEKLEIDLTRYVINLDKRYSASKLSEYLKENKIQVEMNDSHNVVLIFSPFNTEDEFIRLYNVLKSCNLDNIKSDYYNILNYNIPVAKLMPYEVINKNRKSVELKASEGKICAQAIVPYPPGIPLVNLGEVIDKDIISATEYYLENKIDVIGLSKFHEKWIVEVVAD